MKTCILINCSNHHRKLYLVQFLPTQTPKTQYEYRKMVWDGISVTTQIQTQYPYTKKEIMKQEINPKLLTC